MSLVLKAGTDWQTVLQRAADAAPEAISVDGLKNLIDGEWVAGGNIKDHVNPVDGMPILGPTMLDVDTVMHAVQAAKTQDMAWAKTSLAERKEKVQNAVNLMREHRDTLALLLVWEIGKPWKLSCADVDRALEGVEWYIGEIDRQMESREPLGGPVSNIASWNYPMSVLVHAELVQMLAEMQ